MDDLTNFRRSLEQLKTYISLPIQNDRDRAGIIQGFEFTFEQAWKTLQRRAGAEGVMIGSPKAAFSFAMQTGMIDTASEPNWLSAIKDRNLTSHTYREELAKEVVQRISSAYVPMFEKLFAKLSKT